MVQTHWRLYGGWTTGRWRLYGGWTTGRWRLCGGWTTGSAIILNFLTLFPVRIKIIQILGPLCQKSHMNKVCNVEIQYTESYILNGAKSVTKRLAQTYKGKIERAYLQFARLAKSAWKFTRCKLAGQNEKVEGTLKHEIVSKCNCKLYSFKNPSGKN